ncbi:efflux RND transporter periplasmic adaptor subunit [Dickeya fangzhongdai]|uniref:efflux RND transporter periplasmic adaptor subunit n=1 Tax=Dickeya fangzhongdai TaxID=1778540 RepID=UPI00192563FE|nr:efflux RND transporter periplasmic adaptor subunit [Dickeya fangzhongdai]UMB77845.1 efflux RND transporter periplasmic adaptor subunit [Dickeya fangzhongdai]
MSRYKLPLIPLLLMACLLLSACDRHAEKNTELRQVIWTTAEAAPFSDILFTGIVQPHIETEQAFRTLGRVISRNVDVGDMVHKDDILAEIDPLSQQQSVINAQAQLRSAQAQLRNAVLTEQRKRALNARFVISKEEYALARQALATTQADVDKAQANLDKAREQFSYTRLKADFDGVITRTAVEVGQTVQAGQTVLTLASLEQRDAVIDIPGSKLPAIPADSRFLVSLQLDATIRTTGVIREVGPQADSSTRTHRVKIAIDHAPVVFKIGALVTVCADNPNTTSGIVVLPAQSLYQKSEIDGRAQVWTIDPEKNTVSLKSILIDPHSLNARYIRVLQGVNVGEKVVVSGVDKLTEGQHIIPGQRMR